MKHSFVFGLAILICIISSKVVVASDDFQIRPPVLIQDFRKKQSTSDENALQTTLTERDVEYLLRSPQFYFSFGYQTEATWFDRRINWSTYSTQLVYDTGFLGLRYQGSMSEAGREVFELYDSRFDIYAYWSPDYSLPDMFCFGQLSEVIRIGGGLSYFDIEPYQSQEFLFDQHYAAFVNFYFIFAEMKLIMLINDEVWNGGLVEIKIFNPVYLLGMHYPDTAAQNYLYLVFLTAFNLVLPYELGITGSIDLPNDGNDWGWYWKGRYVILEQIMPLKDYDKLRGTYNPHPDFESRKHHISVGLEFYWSYRDEFSNTNVSGGWEFGIKFVLVGF